MVRIAVIAPGHPLDVSIWSGTPFHITKALQRHYTDLTLIEEPRPFWFEPARRVARKLTAGSVDIAWSRTLARRRAFKLAKELVGRRAEIAVCIGVSPLSAFLPEVLPVVHISDATASLMRNYYQEFTGLFSGLADSAVQLDMVSVRRARACLFASNWAAQSAVRDYGADPSRIHVVPFGANIEPLEECRHERYIGSDVFNVVFVGVDWHRKRGDLAVETILTLVNRGLPIRLDIMGAVPPRPIESDHVTVHGYVSKATAAGRALFQQIMSRAHLLFVPTKQECFGIFAAEASAYGVPIISTDTGGLSEVVVNGVNGYLLPLEAGADLYADRIEEILKNMPLYRRLREGAVNRSRAVLNWDTWLSRAARIIELVQNDGSRQ